MRMQLLPFSSGVSCTGALIWLVAMLASPAWACTINMVYSDIATPPQQLGDGQVVPENPGVGVELVNEAANNIGCKIVWRRLPNRRVHIELERGKADASLLLSFSEERTAYLVFPMKQGVPDSAFNLTTISYYVYVSDNSRLTWDGHSFNQRGLIMGVNAGYSAGQDLRKMGITVDEAPSTENNLMKLKFGRIAAYVMQDYPADLFIREHSITGIGKLPVPFASKDYYVPFSKAFFSTSPDIAIRLWDQIAEVRRTRGKELLRKYEDRN